MSREEAIEIIQKLIGRFKSDSRTYKALDMAIKALSQEPTNTWSIKDVADTFKKHGLIREQEPCDDAISREAVDKYIARLLSGYLYDGERERLEIFSAYLWELPSVTQKSGKWIEHPEIETSTPEYLMFYECSECGNKQCFYKSDIHKKRFCTNCGAKMESEDKEWKMKSK